MKWVARRYSFVRRIKLGESYEGESLYALKVTSNRVRSSRPALYMDAATHAREWISPAALMYVCNQVSRWDMRHSRPKEVSNDENRCIDLKVKQTQGGCCTHPQSIAAIKTRYRPILSNFSQVTRKCRIRGYY